MNIVYGEKETAYLAARDKRLGAAIAQTLLDAGARQIADAPAKQLVEPLAGFMRRHGDVAGRGVIVLAGVQVWRRVGQGSLPMAFSSWPVIDPSVKRYSLSSFWKFSSLRRIHSSVMPTRAYL